VLSAGRSGEKFSRFGIPRQEWDRVGTVFVLRSCLVTPFLERETTFDVYWEDFRFSIEKTLSQL
jgi:hypothetical protein